MNNSAKLALLKSRLALLESQSVFFGSDAIDELRDALKLFSGNHCDFKGRCEVFKKFREDESVELWSEFINEGIRKKQSIIL